jgi:hypothetical protein
MAAEAVEVPMELIKKLRGMSGAPIMDCKKALAEEKLGMEGREGREGGRTVGREGGSRVGGGSRRGVGCMLE